MHATLCIPRIEALNPFQGFGIGIGSCLSSLGKPVTCRFKGLQRRERFSDGLSHRITHGAFTIKFHLLFSHTNGADTRHGATIRFQSPR